MTQFHGQVAWVVGATAGIGRAMAREFARRGADVAVSGRRQERLAEVVAEVEGLGRRALAVPCDVRRDDEVAAAVQTIVAHFGRLDVAVANAGFGVIGRVEDLTADDWQRQFETNFFGALSVVRHSLPALRRTGGRLGLVSSVSGILASPRVGAYSASKFALRAVGLTLAMELRGSGVSCTLLNPGFVSTEIGQVDNQGQFEASRQDKRPAALMWTADDAARVMVKAIAARKREYTFTAHGKLGAFLGQHFPGLMCWLQRDARSKTTKLD
ncbi:SDR family NAD(P)-dependent oxidoreductase [Nannocystis pusilla]|uniref:SDR family NAD(P)-dependent oxidoreductase n=1 Tax=Nannocystis pusilla TaxID=889268 RepID=UPI003B7A485E